MVKKSVETGTKLCFIGGVNRDRIGGNCSVIEHTDETGEVTRVMFDLGTMFTPYESGFVSALPNVEEYFIRKIPETGTYIKPSKPVSALFFTHAHEDHIGALIDYTKMGYELPPIKASRFTRALIRIAFTQEGLQAPQIDVIKPQENIIINENMVIEPFTVSHSVIGAMGFHTQTSVNGKPYAGIINNGDFMTEENMRVGESFSLDQYEDLLRRKLTTHIELDSTSTHPHSNNRIGDIQAIENTLKVIQNHPKQNIVISPVISRSIKNIAVDIEIARRLGTKICLSGKWLTLSHQAMQLSGYHDFDDVLYKGKLSTYLADKSIGKKYIVCTGAFAQGLQEYELNQSDFSNIPMASATKMALDLHPEIKIDKNVLLLSRQRIIDEINGKTGPQMLQLFASKGACVVMTPGSRKVGNFEEVQMQDSGHINAEEMGRLMNSIHQYAPDAVIIPIHGKPEQCADTAKIARQHHLKTFLAENMQILNIAADKTEKTQDNQKFYWIGVKKIYFNPLQPDMSVPREGKTEYWHIDEMYYPIEKISETDNVRIYHPGDKGYKISSGKMFDDVNADLLIREPMKNKKSKKFTREEKGNKTRTERDAAKREELKRRKAEKKAKEQTRILKKLGKSIID